eukprot:TRINITY_DN37118_c0_g1_i1.p1 TRINITY_DN37118_c0_g1~~TRINITY_DN37118_c0_g1_i1.p1  ORF type:complete len:579 (-),score=92.27 TRINITY_DN37118_c0_g1_i1:77-1813(-)
MSAAALEEAASLGRRALVPWLAQAGRRPLPRGAVAPAAEDAAGVYGSATHAQRMQLLADVRAARAPPQAAVSAYFVMARHGAPISRKMALDLWQAVASAGAQQGGSSSSTSKPMPQVAKDASVDISSKTIVQLLSLGGRGLCDLLHVLSTAKGFPRHEEVALLVADALCHNSTDYRQELQMWPQTVPFVADYLARHAPDVVVLTAFLERVLTPFWQEEVDLAIASLAPHHAAAVSAACDRCSKSLPVDARRTVHDVLVNWADLHTQRLGSRGIANLALALARLMEPGEDDTYRRMNALMRRSSDLLEDPKARRFRPDWLGMLTAALAKTRCRCDPSDWRRLLATHLLLSGAAKRGTERPPLLHPSEVQNVALVAHSTLKLDLHELSLELGAKKRRGDLAPVNTTALTALKPAVLEACEADKLRTLAGRRSAALLAHAYGAALLLHGGPVSAQAESLVAASVAAAAYDEVLQRLFLATAWAGRLPDKTERIRFQLLSAVQCWWCVCGGPGATLRSLRRAHSAVRAHAVDSSGDASWAPYTLLSCLVCAKPKQSRHSFCLARKTTLLVWFLQLQIGSGQD